MSDEFGPWIEHDGKGCPCVGEYVDVISKTGERAQGWATGKYTYGMSAWDWRSTPLHLNAIRYRIRKPRGLTILESLLADLPEQVDA